MLKRSRSRSPSSWQHQKSPRPDTRKDRAGPLDAGTRSGRESYARQQARRNQIHENKNMRDWVSQEDDFVLQQSKKKAKIRVREARAKPIDLLAVALGVLDTTGDILEDDSSHPDFDIIDPEKVILTLESEELRELINGIDTYLVLESRKSNTAFWKAARIICKDRLEHIETSKHKGRGLSSVSSDIDKVLEPKTFDQLVLLEKTVTRKLDSDEALDEEYWEQLLSSIGVYKAKAELDHIFLSIVSKMAESRRAKHVTEAEQSQKPLRAIAINYNISTLEFEEVGKVPRSLLSVPPTDKSLRVFEETEFLTKIAEDRKMVFSQPLKLQGAVGLDGLFAKQRIHSIPKTTTKAIIETTSKGDIDHSQATKALYDREAARGVQDDEEVFNAEEEVTPTSKPKWSGNYQPRKPRYFNRVQMGYEWNKYNQTHYDQDNPPPKVVQGYKFNIFYPELSDKTKAPTYKIERENGRKRGQSFAPAGEEDTCLIRFISGAPYEDIAFRIVDREWDYSAKRERGFKSSFDKGILQLHFHFKKVYYRK